MVAGEGSLKTPLFNGNSPLLLPERKGEKSADPDISGRKHSFCYGMAMKVSPQKANVLPMLAGVLCFFFLQVILFPTLAEIKVNHSLAFEMASMDRCDAVFEKYERITESIPVWERALKTGGSAPLQSLNTFFNFSSPISPSPVLRC